MSSAVGLTGIVTIRVPGGDHPGQVRLRGADGVLENFVAFATDPVPAATEVLVTNQRGPLTVDVQTWTLGYVAPGEK